MPAQEGCEIRCEWGLEGARALSPSSDVVVIVDVLSFSTTVEVATARGATVFPFPMRDETARAFASFQNAQLANPRGQGGLSLSPVALSVIPPGMRLVLPSPNGSTLSLTTGEAITIAGSLRNASRVAEVAVSLGRRISVIPAGERWRDEGTIRFAIEDYLGAGAILSRLSDWSRSRRKMSPEAELCVHSYNSAKDAIVETIRDSTSGRELIERGYAADVEMATELDGGSAVPILGEDRAYVDAGRGPQVVP